MGQGMKINGSAWPSNCCGFPSITLSLWKLVKLKKNSYKLYSVIGLFVWLIVLLVFFCLFFPTKPEVKLAAAAAAVSQPCFVFFILSSACLSNCTCPFVNTRFLLNEDAYHGADITLFPIPHSNFFIPSPSLLSYSPCMYMSIFLCRQYWLKIVESSYTFWKNVNGFDTKMLFH